MSFQVTEKMKIKLAKKTEAKPNCCVEWIGYRDRQGYGRAWFDYQPIGAHRLSWSIANGPIPEGMCVLHRCDNPSCVNPEHLFLGTVSENHKDMMLKKRNVLSLGERNGQSKLDAAKVREIRALKGIETQRRIAGRFGICCENIRQIWSRQTWKHVD